MSKVVYIAEPLDAAANHMPISWVVPDDWTIFRPGQAFNGVRGAEGAVQVERVNRAVLATVDGVMAFLPHGVPTIGVPAEIEWAIIHEIPVAIVTNNHASIAIRGFALRGAVVTESVRVARDSLSKMMAEQPEQGEIGFVRNDDKAILPSRGYPDDVGLDLYASADVRIPVHQFRDVPCGIVANLRPGTWGFITGRSSTLRRHKLWVYNGVVDPSFRGELFVGVWNMGGATYDVTRGERLGQLIIMPAVTPVPVWASAIFPGQSDRGQAGFGSTGA